MLLGSKYLVVDGGGRRWWVAVGGVGWWVLGGAGWRCTDNDEARLAERMTE